MPVLSVLLPVHNAARYLPAALASLRTQTLGDFEVIAVDDGSTDRSRQILADVARDDGRFRVVSRANTGIVGALNDAFALARAPLLARMDADDVADPGRFSAQVAFLAAHPGCVAVGTAAWLIDSDGAVIDRFAPPAASAAIERELLRGNGAALLHPSALLRRDALYRVGGYDPAFCRAEDLDLYFRLLPLGALANLPAPLLRYRLHAASTNFVRRGEQKRLILRLLTRECSARGLPPPALGSITGPADLPPAELHRQWACTSCRHGRFRTALKHAWHGLRRAPLDRAGWRVLRYVLGHSTSSRRIRRELGAPQSLSP